MRRAVVAAGASAEATGDKVLVRVDVVGADTVRAGAAGVTVDPSDTSAVEVEAGTVEIGAEIIGKVDVDAIGRGDIDRLKADATGVDVEAPGAARDAIGSSSNDTGTGAGVAVAGSLVASSKATKEAPKRFDRSSLGKVFCWTHEYPTTDLPVVAT